MGVGAGAGGGGVKVRRGRGAEKFVFWLLGQERRGWALCYAALPLRRPPSLLFGFLMTSARSMACPPFPPLEAKVPPPPPPPPYHKPPPPPSTPSMPPCADVVVPGSCLRGESQACLMCDETESSEPLGDLGSREVVVVVVGVGGRGN